MFCQIIGHRNVVNYWIFALQWQIGMKQETPKLPPIFVISLNFGISKKNKIKNSALSLNLKVITV